MFGIININSETDCDSDIGSVADTKGELMKIFSSVSDWFTNPDSPGYYVVGAIALVIVIGLLTLFIVLDGKRKKKKAKEQAEQLNAAANEETVNDGETVEQAENTEVKDGEKENETEEVVPNDNESETLEVKEEAEPEQSVTEAPLAEASESVDKESTKEVAENDTEQAVEVKQAEQKAESSENTEKETENKEPVKKTKKPAPKKEPTIKVTTSANTKATPAVEMPPVELEKKTEKPAKTKSAKSTKPFIDKLLADKAVHGVYNELKNTILSYPGIKAKLTKDEEIFMFGVDKKAALKLDGENLDLYLALDPATVPSQFNMKKSNDAELPVMLQAESGSIDMAQKAIIFAMNVSLLTRNSSHRHVDYVKKALDAKQRAKSKK